MQQQVPDASLTLTANEVARIYQVKVITVREWAKTGRLPGEKIGRDWRFPARIRREAGERQSA